jgi:hypothetical protein
VPNRKKDPPTKRFSRLFSNSEIKQGDFNGDGSVNITDLSLMLTNYDTNNLTYT